MEVLFQANICWSITFPKLNSKIFWWTFLDFILVWLGFFLWNNGLCYVFRCFLSWDLQPDNMAQASISLNKFQQHSQRYRFAHSCWESVNNELTFGKRLFFSPQMPLAIIFVIIILTAFSKNNELQGVHWHASIFQYNTDFCLTASFMKYITL